MQLGDMKLKDESLFLNKYHKDEYSNLLNGILFFDFHLLLTHTTMKNDSNLPGIKSLLQILCLRLCPLPPS